MELTQEHHDILSELTNSDQPIFLTGAAGTGKTTLIKYWLDNVRKCCIKLAPTGIAALNLDGETIHSFFRFPPNLFTPNQLAPFDHEKFMRVDVIVIDEVSMCLGVLIDCIDSFLRQVRRNNSPFGGIKIIFTGDLFQLPPIVPKSDDFDGAWFLRTQGYKSEWFFDAKVFREFPLRVLTLNRVYRQNDLDFLDILNRVRVGQATLADFKILNARRQPISPSVISLCTTNKRCAQINQVEQNKLNTNECLYSANITGNFKPGDCNAELDLFLRVGDQVMTLINEKGGGYKNGMIGRVVGLRDAPEFSNEEEEDSPVIQVQFDGDRHPKNILSFQWEKKKYELSGGELDCVTTGTFTQYPVKLAYAVTVHKSQGLQFPSMILDSSYFFAAGQLYVALSRCESLGGLVIKQPIKPAAMITDRRVLNFMERVC